MHKARGIHQVSKGIYRGIRNAPLGSGAALVKDVSPFGPQVHSYPSHTELKNVLKLSPKPLHNVLKLEKKKPTHVLAILPIKKAEPKHLLKLSPKPVVTGIHTLDLTNKHAKSDAKSDALKHTLKHPQNLAQQYTHGVAHTQHLKSEIQPEILQSELTKEVDAVTVKQTTPHTGFGFGFKAAVFVLLVAINWIGLSFIGGTRSYFNDTEISEGNLLSSGLLDLIAQSETDPRDIQCGGETSFYTMAQTGVDSIDIVYGGYAEFVGGSHEFCKALNVVARKDGDLQYSGPLLDFFAEDVEGSAAWQFAVSLPQNATQFTHGTQCHVDIVFAGFGAMEDSFDESGWTDIERVPIRLTKDITGCVDNGCTHEQGNININIENNNNAVVENTVDINLNTGGNSANGGNGGAGGSGGDGGNGGSGGTIVTGNASATVVIDQTINTNETTVNVSSCCTCQGGGSTCKSGQQQSQQSTAQQNNSNQSGANITNTNNTSVNNSTSINSNVSVQSNTSGTSPNTSQSASQSASPNTSQSTTNTSSLADEIKKKLEEQLAKAGIGNRGNR